MSFLSTVCKLNFIALLLLLSGKLPAFFGEKFEPPDGMIYHGAQAEVRPLGINKFGVDWDGIEEYTKAVGHRPKLIMHYLNLNPMMFALLKDKVKQIAEQPYDYYAQIGLDFYYFPVKKKFKKRRDISQEIVRHGYDMVLKNIADLFKSMEIPIFLRLGYEFGGKGFGSEYNKSSYVQAWRYIVDLFNEEGVTNVAFVWNNLDEKKYMEYYPGDEYVDWWAIDIFDTDPVNHPLIFQFITDAEKHRKPVMIAESTPKFIGTQQTEVAIKQWFEPYFRMIRKYSNIKAFCYINSSWRDYPDPSFSKDCRLQINPQLADLYKQIISESIFIHASPK